MTEAMPGVGQHGDADDGAATDALGGALRASELLAPGEAATFARHGHCVYESGLHGDTLLLLDALFAEPRRLRTGAERLAERIARYAPDAVCAPYAGGALVGLLVAEALGRPFVPASPAGREAAGSARYALPDHADRLLTGARVALIDDAVNAGSATLACARAVRAAGGEPVVAGALFARAPGAAEGLVAAGAPLVALVGLPFRAWPPAACPLCRAGLPLDPAG